MRYSLLLLITALLGVIGCSSKSPEPVTPPPEAKPEVVSPEPTPSPVKPAPVELGPPTVEPEKPSVDASIREAAGKLARKEGNQWKIDDAARKQLDELGSQATEQLLPLLEDSSPDVRRGAAYYLLGQFDPAHEPTRTAFVKLLGDDDRTIRGIALQAIQRMPSVQKAQAAPELVKLLESKDSDETQRAEVVRILVDLGEPAKEHVEALKSVAKEDPSPKVRSAAVIALSKLLPPKEAVDVHSWTIDDPDSSVQRVALARLKALGPDAATAAPKIALLLESDDEKTRTAAAEALIRIGSKAVSPLAERLSSKSAHARQAAVHALGKMGAVASPALPQLKQLETDADPKVAQSAKIAVAAIEGAR